MRRLSTTAALFLMTFASLFGQPPHSFFTIHCDPGFAHLFPKLKQMVDTATAHEVPLTLELSPQWVYSILNNPEKLQLVREWQAWGHEIAAHHHSIYHCYWDSLTNYPLDSIAFHQPISPFCDSGILISPMKPFWDSLDVLCGDSLLLTWGSSDEHPAVDMYPHVPYRTTGGRTDPAQAFSNPYTETHGPTTIGDVTYGPYTTCQVDYFFIDNLTKVNALKNLYQDTSFSNNYSVVGVVTHVFDFNSSPVYFYNWIQFIEGKGCKTVRQILRQSGCSPTSDAEAARPAGGLRVFPNPADDLLQVELSAGLEGWLRIWNTTGQLMWEGKIRASTPLNVSGWPTGLYVATVQTDRQSMSSNFLIQR